MADPVMIRLQHSLARNLLLPWHGIDQFAFSMVLVGVILAVFHRVDPDAVMFVTASAWAGIVGVSLGTAPAVATITTAQYADVVRNLKRRGFTHHDATRSLHAPCPAGSDGSPPTSPELRSATI